jgi:hypothetical protein
VNAATEGLALLDADVDPADPRLDEVGRRIVAGIERQIDSHLAELAEIAPPAPGFDRRKEQKRHDRLSRALDDLIALRDEAVELTIATAEYTLDRADVRADADARAFDLELQELLSNG